MGLELGRAIARLNPDRAIFAEVEKVENRRRTREVHEVHGVKRIARRAEDDKDDTLSHENMRLAKAGEGMGAICESATDIPMIDQ